MNLWEKAIAVGEALSDRGIETTLERWVKATTDMSTRLGWKFTTTYEPGRKFAGILFDHELEQWSVSELADNFIRNMERTRPS